MKQITELSTEEINTVLSFRTNKEAESTTGHSIAAVCAELQRRGYVYIESDKAACFFLKTPGRVVVERFVPTGKRGNLGAYAGKYVSSVYMGTSRNGRLRFLIKEK